MLSRYGLAVAALLTLAACGDAPPPQKFADIRFPNSDPIRLGVTTVELASDFQPSFQPPQVEQYFPVPPQRAIENWARDRLRADNSGSDYHAKVTIMNAEADERPGSGGYDIRVEARIEIVDAHGFVVRSAHAEATRGKTIEADATPDEKDQLWYAITRDAVGNLGGELERQIRGTFYPYVL